MLLFSGKYLVGDSARISRKPGGVSLVSHPKERNKVRGKAERTGKGWRGRGRDCTTSGVYGMCLNNMGLAGNRQDLCSRFSLLLLPPPMCHL